MIDKEKALKKLGEIPLIDMKIKVEQRNKNKTVNLCFSIPDVWNLSGYFEIEIVNKLIHTTVR